MRHIVKIAVVFSMAFLVAGAILLSLRLLYALRRYAVAIRHCGAHFGNSAHHLCGKRRLLGKGVV